MTARPAATLPRQLADFRRLLSLAGKVEITVAVAGLVITIILSATQALLRYAFGTSLWWTGEVVQYAIFASYFLGVSYVFKTRQYILIEFLSVRAPLRLQLVFYCIAQLLTIVFTGGTVWLLYLFLPTLLNMHTPLLGLPGFIAPIPLVLASVMMVATSLYYLAFGIWALARRLPGTAIADIELLALIARPLEDAEAL